MFGFRKKATGLRAFVVVHVASTQRDHPMEQLRVCGCFTGVCSDLRGVPQLDSWRAALRSPLSMMEAEFMNQSNARVW